ncbi:LysM peptidoglycan-binding domain-containing protein [Bacillus marinisedimentorum]|uniref:LysM peptidoglycan-binding domain-containing protein n=1 Tax=Bacillus marinisedimentorum TaxID=1821260 RepID=UPI0012FF9762|nr:LysM peptidoglycan-binding domain-containing protein [Bacillus marinisedimentorum]
MEKHNRRSHAPQAGALRRQSERLSGEQMPESENAGQREELPPRRAYHSRQKTKKKHRLKYPGIRLLVLLFIVLLLLIPYYTKFIEQIEGTEQIFSYKEDTDQQYDFAKSGQEAAVAEKQVSAETPDPPEESDTAAPDGRNGNGPDPANGTGEKDVPVQAEDRAPHEKERDTQPAPENSLKEDEQSYKIVYHKVKPEETLFRISMNYYGSRDGEELIRKWNGLSGNDIDSGQELKIPLPR